MNFEVLNGGPLTAKSAIDDAAARVAQGVQAVFVYSVANGPLHWLHGAQARGWVRPDVRLAATTATAFDRDWHAWRQRGFVAEDAALLALAGPDCQLPALSWDEQLPAYFAGTAGVEEQIGLYAIVDSVSRLRQVLLAGITTVQLRIKQPPDADRSWHEALRVTLQEGIAVARDAGARLYINDHWVTAVQLGGEAVHLGQEDVLALGEAGRERLRASGLALGISSHAVWELCRARTLAPHYIACGPVWPTTTKDMPWVPQGLDNLAWWCRAAGAPVVAIGGILQQAQVEQSAAAGATGVCVLRGLGANPAATVPALGEAFLRGRARIDLSAQPLWPHPTLEPRT